MLDDKVIDGHVIPGEVLFTAPSPLEHPFETLAFGDNLKVTVSFKRDANAVGDKNGKGGSDVAIRHIGLITACLSSILQCMSRATPLLATPNTRPALYKRKLSEQISPSKTASFILFNGLWWSSTWRSQKFLRSAYFIFIITVCFKIYIAEWICSTFLLPNHFFLFDLLIFSNIIMYFEFFPKFQCKWLHTTYWLVWPSVSGSKELWETLI